MTSTQTTKSFPPGIHAPSVTFFIPDDDRQEIDWKTQERHLDFLVKSGVHGIVVAGSSGESATLTADEKAQLIRKTREVAKANGRDNFPITMGCWAGCTRDIVHQISTGHESGADFALVLVPSVFHWAMNKNAIVAFFQDIADRSPIPIVIYNLPAIVSGLEVDSDMLEALSSHPNICAVKLTCGSIGKITRVAAQHSPSHFAALAGQSDLLVPAMVAGASGCISGVANLFPRVLIELYNLSVDGKIIEATVLQKKLGQPEWGIATSDVSGMKWIIVKERGYPETSADCRRPFPRFVDPEKRERVVKLVAPLLSVEGHLSSKK